MTFTFYVSSPYHPDFVIIPHNIGPLKYLHNIRFFQCYYFLLTCIADLKIFQEQTFKKSAFELYSLLKGHYKHYFFLCVLCITAPSWTLIQLIIIDSYFFFKLLTIGSLYFFQWKGTWYYSFQWKSSDFEKTFEKHFWKPFEKHSSECHLVKNTISPMVINYNPCKITIKYYYIAYYYNITYCYNTEHPNFPRAMTIRVKALENKNSVAAGDPQRGWSWVKNFRFWEVWIAGKYIPECAILKEQTYLVLLFHRTKST